MSPKSLPAMDQSEFLKTSSSAHTVQDIFLSSMDAVRPPPCEPLTDDDSAAVDEYRRRPSSASRIPIRQRDSSSPPSLAGSGRSTPVQPTTRPPMRREGSSPPGMLATTPQQISTRSSPPPIAPKPSHEKIGYKLSQPNSGKNSVYFFLKLFVDWHSCNPTRVSQEISLLLVRN